MAFRADEAAADGFERAFRDLSPGGPAQATREQRELVKRTLTDIIRDCGPVVDGYPAWHPFMTESDPVNWAPMTPHGLPSYRLMDHTVYLANGMITCPYQHAVDELFESVGKLRNLHESAEITIEKIEGVSMHAKNAVPILIKCEWREPLNDDGTIPSNVAVGLMLEREVPGWRNSKYSETWQDMSPQLLGYPHGARSSLFVNQQTGQMMKDVWNQLVKAGLWGGTRK